MAEADDLYTVKNNYWLGNFQDAIAEAKSLRLKADLRVERDVYVYRSLVGLKNYKCVACVRVLCVKKKCVSVVRS